MKKFKFRGKIYEASDYMQYAAMDKTGELYTYAGMPKLYSRLWCSAGEGYNFIATLEDSEGWEDSLLEIDKVLVEEAPAPAPPRPVDLAYLQSSVKANTDLQWELYEGLTGLRPGTVMKILFDVDMTQHPKLRKPKSVWDLKEGDTCYRLNINGGIGRTSFGQSEVLTRENGGIFLTMEEAGQVRALRRARARINKVISGMDIPEVNFGVLYPDQKELVCASAEILVGGYVGVATIEQAQMLILECEDELKLILDPELAI